MKANCLLELLDYNFLSVEITNFTLVDFREHCVIAGDLNSLSKEGYVVPLFPCYCESYFWSHTKSLSRTQDHIYNFSRIQNIFDFTILVSNI